MNSQFFTVFFAVLLAIFVAKVIKFALSRSFQVSLSPVNLISPMDAIMKDLGRVFDDVNCRLPRDMKTKYFPVKFDIGQHKNTWCEENELIRIVSAQLERVGWIVSKTDECGPNEIMLDIPRKTFSE